MMKLEYIIFKSIIFLTYAFHYVIGEMRCKSFTYQCDIPYVNRSSALQEIILTKSERQLPFCAVQCTLYSQCEAIELCYMDKHVTCRLLNQTTTSCSESDDGQTCRHLRLNEALLYNQECKLSQLGKEYRGYVNTTIYGKTCQRWDEQYPHNHSRDALLPGLPSDHVNYCRNPDNETEGPWCYTTNTSVRWEYCDVPQCAECRTTSTGSEYRGILSTTISGRTCQDWNSQTPHSHNKAAMMPWSASGHGNYCRNPDNRDGGPWCYTTDPSVTSEFCDIKLC